MRERDARVVAAAWRLIAREGLGALTVKALADEAAVAPSSMLDTMPNHAVVRERALEAIAPAIRQRIGALPAEPAPRGPWRTAPAMRRAGGSARGRAPLPLSCALPWGSCPQAGADPGRGRGSAAHASDHALQRLEFPMFPYEPDQTPAARAARRIGRAS